MSKCIYHLCEKEATGRSTFCGPKCKSKYFVTRRRMVVKLKSIEYKGGACQHCGIAFDGCPDIFDFHHIDPSEKDFSISQNGKTISWENLKVELDKCVLLCANCHRKEHFRLKKTHYILDKVLSDYEDSFILPPKEKIPFPTKEEMEKLVWEKSILKLSKEYKVGQRTIQRFIEKNNIETPPFGYWNEAGKTSNRTKVIVVTHPDGSTHEYHGLEAAAEAYKVSKHTVKNWCQGKCKQPGVGRLVKKTFHVSGYKFNYK